MEVTDINNLHELLACTISVGTRVQTNETWRRQYSNNLSYYCSSEIDAKYI